MERKPTSDWHTQVDKLLAEYESITRERYAAELTSFCAWYLQSYGDEPDASVRTDGEVRDYRIYLTGVKGYEQHGHGQPADAPNDRQLSNTSPVVMVFTSKRTIQAKPISASSHVGMYMARPPSHRQRYASY